MNLLQRFTGLAVVCLALVSCLRAADLFEGRVAMAITESKKKEPINAAYSIKGQRIRMDVQLKKSEGSPAIIFDYAKKEMLILMDQDGEKMFIRQKIKDQPHAGGEAGGGDAKKISEPVATGRTETILGYLASEYKLDGEKGETTELWLAKGLGQFVFPAAGGGGGPFGGGHEKASPLWAKIIGDQGFFPLRVVTHDAKGAERMRLEVTKIEKTAVPESAFSTEGYNEFQMPSFGGMGGLPGMGGKDN